MLLHVANAMIQFERRSKLDGQSADEVFAVHEKERTSVDVLFAKYFRNVTKAKHTDHLFIIGFYENSEVVMEVGCEMFTFSTSSTDHLWTGPRSVGMRLFISATH